MTTAEAEFRDERGTFVVCFRKTPQAQTSEPMTKGNDTHTREKLLNFCRVPRTRQEIAAFLDIKSVPYAVRAHVAPLVEQGMIGLSMPEKPRSPKQHYITKRPE